MKSTIFTAAFLLIGFLSFSQIVYVSPEGSGAKDGSSWSDALAGNEAAGNGYTRLADTLAVAAPSAVFWIAEGTYLPSTDNDRDKSFRLPEQVAVYGGFAGNETTLEQRDIAAHPTILSGNIGDPVLETDNAYHVLTTIGPYWYQHAFLNGLTITGGYAQDPALPNNAVQKYGGGIYSSHKLTLEHCRFHHNKATSGGGAIYIRDYGMSSWMINELIVNHCQFDSNSLLANSRGGAIQVYRGYRAFPSTIQNTLFFNNNAFYGSAIHANGTCTLNNCLLANNSAQNGALVVEYGSGNVHHSTIVNNSGRGVFIMTGGSVLLQNSIVWGGGPVSGMSGTTYSAQHSCLEGGNTLNGNINTDPLFVNPSTGPGSAYAGDLADWQLRWCSPCFNSGDSTLVYPGTSVDLAGQPRVLYSQTDMGAYELDTTGLIPNAVNYAATPLYVTDSAQYYGDGSSWSQAVAGNAESCKYPGQTLLYEAMRDAAPGTELWLKKGIYKSTTTGNRNHYFELSDGVLVYGGFEGTEADTSQRGNGITLFSGDFGQAGDSTDNARHVLKINAANATFSDTALLDRIQIRHGHADGTGEEANGAGIWVGTGTKLKLNYSKVERNSAKSVGSGIYTQPGTLLLVNRSDVSRNTQRTTTSSSGTSFYGSPGCGVYNQGKLIAFQSRFNHNRNASEGIAIYNADSLWMYHCSLDSNESVVTATSGGALSSAKYTRLFNCALQHNKASILGGGAWNKASSYLEMDSCLVGFNQCTSTGNGSGGGLYNDGQLVLYNTSLLHNQSKLDGGGLCNSPTGTADIDRCTVAYNLASGGPVFSGGGGLYNGGTMHVNRTKICNNSTDKNGGGIYNPTTLRNSLVANNSKGGQYTVAGGIRVTEACQSIINSTIVNNNGQGIAAAYINNWGNLVNLADTFSIHNSICFGNEIQLAGNFQITHSCIEGGHPGQGNFFDNPVFQLPSNGYGANINGLNADWSLISCSPCIDRGDSSWLNNNDLFDITGSPRVYGPRVDIGAYELQEIPGASINYSAGRVYLSASTIPAGLGASWSDTLSGNAPSCRYPGFTLLYEAMKDAPDSSVLWLKKGIYKPCLDNDRQKSFEIKPGLKVFGGFAGGETVLEERIFSENQTILSGNIGDPADSLDNSFHVVYAFGGDSAWNDSTIFNGLCIQEGNANYNCGYCLHKDIVGGGVYLEQNSRLYLENCTIRNNFGLGNYTTSPTLIGKLGGGAVYNQGNLTINKSRITRNTADKMGGAVFNLNNLRISHTMIDSNRIHFAGSQFSSSWWGGGAIFNKESGYMVMDSCSLIGNIINNVHLPGGGIRNTGTMEFENMNYFEGNSNGAISSDKSFSISNSKFLRNEGGLSCADTVVVTGCYFFGNNGSAISGGLHSTITSCVLDSNYTAISTSGISKVSNCTITRGDNKGFLTSSTGGIFNIVVVVTGKVGSGIRHEGDSLVVNNCLFENNLAAGGSGVALLSGYGKIENSIFRNNAGDAGSAIKNHGLVDVSNCLIVNNHSHRYGIIANVENGKMNLYNSTIANNRFHFLIPNTVFRHGTYYNDPGETHFKIRNSIIKSTNAGVFGYEPNNTGTDSVAYSCVTGGFAGSGNINADPAFVLEIPHNNYSRPPSSANWTLSACSPCIDAGNDTLVTDTTDLAGNARIYNRVDMGAYELAYNNALVAGEATQIGRTQALLHWENLVKPCRTAIFLKPVTTGQPTPDPLATYLADTVFGQGSNLDGWYCVFNGDGDTVAVSGLTAGTTYRVAVFNYLFNQAYDAPLLYNFTTEQIVMPDIVKIFGDAPFTLQATAASGITSFDYTTDSLQVCTIAGDTVTLTGCGTALIKVRHAGNSYYLPDSTTALLTVNFQMDVPQQINGPDTVCRGDAQVLYAITPLARATSYGWTLPQGVTGSSDSASILLTFGAGATSGVVSVRGINLCGEGDAAQLPVTILQPPATAGAITGSATPCAGTTHTYSVTPQTGITYTWMVPLGWTLSSGQGTAAITVITGALPGAIGVVPSNFCGDGDTSTLVISPLNVPAPQGAIAGTTDTCANVAGVTFSVMPQPGVSYNWIAPNGWIITSGQSTASIGVTTGAQGGLLWAIPSNGCGTGPGDSLVIAILQPPSQPSAIAGNTLCCQSDTVTLSVEPQSDVDYQWQLPAGWTLMTGQGTSQITAAAGFNGGTVMVTPSNGCGEGQPATTSVAVNFVLADAGTGQQIGYGTSTTLYGNATNGSGSYSWNWQPATLLLNPTLQNPVTTSLTATQQFFLQVADQVTGCTDTDTVLVEVQGMPLAAYGTATPDTTCPGDLVQLNAVVLYGTGQYEYIWTSNPAGFLSTLPNPQVFPEQSTYYNLVVTDGNATVTDEVIVTVTPLPEAPAQPAGPDTVNVAMNPVSSYFTSPVAGATGYQWNLEPWLMGTLSPNGNQATVEWTNIGTAMLTVSALNDCGITASEPLTIVVDNTIGIVSAQPGQVLVTPNPFGNALTVTSLQATPLRLELFDASGALVVTIANPQPVSTLLTAGLVAGVYHLRITFASGVVVKKVVKE